MTDHAVKRYSTEYIKIDKKLCKACWKCVKKCPEGVIGKVKLSSHKHAGIVHSEKCNGCLKCVKKCPEDAISPVKI